MKLPEWIDDNTLTYIINRYDRYLFRINIMRIQENDELFTFKFYIEDSYKMFHKEIILTSINKNKKHLFSQVIPNVNFKIMEGLDNFYFYYTNSPYDFNRRAKWGRGFTPHTNLKLDDMKPLKEIINSLIPINIFYDTDDNNILYNEKENYVYIGSRFYKINKAENFNINNIFVSYEKKNIILCDKNLYEIQIIT